MNNNTAFPRTGCNPMLPTDALDVSALVPGMQIRIPFSGERGVVANVTPYYFNGRVKVLFTSGQEIRCSLAGTVRILTDEPYNYHNGCCDKS